MKKLLILPALLMILPGIALSDATVTYSVPTGDTTAAPPSDALIQNGRVLVRNAGDANTDLLFDPANSTMYVIDHGSQTYLLLDEATIDSLQQQATGMRAMVMQQLQNMPPEQRAQMEQMMQSMGINTQPAVERPVPTLETIGETSFSGFDCTEMRVLEEGTQIATACLSDRDDLGLSESDFQAMVGMQNFTFDLASRAKDLAAQMGNSIPNLTGASLEELIIQLSDESGTTTDSMNITSINNADLPAGSTDLPDGYSQQEMPSLESMMQQ